MIMPVTEEQIGARYESFKYALEKFFERNGHYIVETGCIRWEGDFASGGSTYIFAKMAQEYEVRFDSIDLNPASIEASKKTLGEPLAFHVMFTEDESVKTLKKRKYRIDLLYLDSLGSSAEPEKAQAHQLAEIEAAYHALTDNSIVILDDNSEANGGKTVLSKKFLIEKGWQVVIDKTQCVLVKTL